MIGPLNGVLSVDKPEGMTSHDVVAAVRRRLPRGTRVGHTGTLDPFATGVLPVVIGKATRLSQFLTSTRKAYRATVAFGSSTDSGDRTGVVVETARPDALDALDAGSVRDAIAGLVGTHPQVPPAHSAKKVDGERAYVLARRGHVVELAPVEVTAYTIALTAWEPQTHAATVDLEVSSGYYVRSFARDLGARLGVPAHLAALRRTAAGPFAEATACPLGEVLADDAEALAQRLVPIADTLPQFPAMRLQASQVDAVLHGLPITPTPEQVATSLGRGDQQGRVRLLDDDGHMVALARPAEAGAATLHADIVLR